MADKKTMADWQKGVQAMKDRSGAVDWSKVDWSGLTAKDVGYKLGPVMTEEQFAEYRKQTGGRVHVVKASAHEKTPK